MVSQDYDNIELVVVDDGSTDHTAEVLGSIDLSGRKYQYVEAKGNGAASARNTGLKHSTGKFVLFLDADDILLPGSISLLMSKLFNANADLVVGGWSNFNYERRESQTQLHVKTYFSRSSYANIIYNRPVTSSFILRKSTILLQLAIKRWSRMFFQCGREMVM